MMRNSSELCGFAEPQAKRSHFWTIKVDRFGSYFAGSKAFVNNWPYSRLFIFDCGKT
jgi:hypothetical protein